MAKAPTGTLSLEKKACTERNFISEERNFISEDLILISLEGGDPHYEVI